MPESRIPTPHTAELVYYKGATEPVIIDGCQEYTLYIKATEYKELPVEANVRLPEERPGGAYKDMLYTLNNYPSGIYLMVFNQQKGIVTKKVVITK